MKLRTGIVILAMAAMSLTGCEKKQEDSNATTQSAQSQIATGSDLASASDVVEDWMTPISADDIKEGTYEIEVSSSSKMFKITACTLVVEGGKMTATMTMGGTGYRYIYPGSCEAAVLASESEYIEPVEAEEGIHTFTVDVNALDEAFDCAAFSNKKEKWYERTLVFRSDSLPTEAFVKEKGTSLETLNLQDGQYSVAVSLSGGSGKASVESPTKLVVADNKAIATIVMSSDKYDYMIVDGEKYLPVSTEGNSVFEIPVSRFDCEMPISADTTAMSTPHEIDYTLHFESDTIKQSE